MRLLAVTLAALILAVTAAAARNPHDPQEHLNAADNAAARAILVHKADLAGPWKAERSAPGNDPPCKTFDPDLSDLTVTGKAEGPDFSREDGVTVSSQAEVYETEADMRASFDRSIKLPLLRCLDAAFREGAKGAKIKTLTMRRAPTQRFGERTARYQLTWSLADQGTSAKVFAEAYFVGKGRNGVSILLLSTPGQVTAVAQRDLVKRVAARL